MCPLVAKQEASKDFQKKIIFSASNIDITLKIGMFVTHTNMHNILNAFYGPLHMSGIIAYFWSEMSSVLSKCNLKELLLDCSR